ELSMSRTGIHGGIRRGAAAAAIGAVLVLTTGAPASQAEEGAPDPGDSATPAVDTKSLPVVASLTGQHGREDAPGQNRDKNSNAGGNGKPAARPAVSASASASASAVPSALLPAITATQSPGFRPAPTATPSPVPTADAPAYSTQTPTRPATSPAGNAPASPGTSPAPASSGPAQTSAPASSAAASPAVVGPAAGTPSAGAPAGQVPGPQETSAGAAGQNGQTGFNAAQLPGATKGQGAETTPGTAPAAAAAGHAAYVPIYAVPQANSAWTPSYSTGAQGNSVRSSAELKAQPEPKSALVWLGSGLVGVAGAAGLVFFRLRNP
ncbi:MAG: hypothetical protein JWQ56_3903, partial [Pseudarthrobacter sp.]|nr:hypothetical protein [Pseudarthrobacter sp.]